MPGAPENPNVVRETVVHVSELHGDDAAFFLNRAWGSLAGIVMEVYGEVRVADGTARRLARWAGVELEEGDGPYLVAESEVLQELDVEVVVCDLQTRNRVVRSRVPQPRASGREGTRRRLHRTRRAARRDPPGGRAGTRGSCSRRARGTTDA